MDIKTKLDCHQEFYTIEFRGVVHETFTDLIVVIHKVGRIGILARTNAVITYVDLSGREYGESSVYRSLAEVRVAMIEYFKRITSDCEK